MFPHVDFVCLSCVHPVAVLNATLCITCSMLMLVKDARGDHMEEAYSRGLTEGACTMAVPSMSTRLRDSALQMPSTHPAIRNASHR